MSDRGARWLVGMVLAAACALPAGAQRGAPKGYRVGDLTWQEAARRLSASTVVVIPIGAEAKEHGPHLRLDNDLTLANWYTKRLMAERAVAVYPTLNYNFYPAFVDYPGSTSLRFETARDLMVDVVRSIARHGPRRFYFLNTGISTLRPLREVVTILAADGLLVDFLDLGVPHAPDVQALMRQPGGTHADEEETSEILYMAPDRVDMRKAVRDYHLPREGPLSPDSGKAGTTWSPTGSWGDPTLATREKGRRLAEEVVARILAQVDALRTAPLPSATR